MHVPGTCSFSLGFLPAQTAAEAQMAGYEGQKPVVGWDFLSSAAQIQPEDEKEDGSQDREKEIVSPGPGGGEKFQPDASGVASG
jgi:hypothetical protein